MTVISIIISLVILVVDRLTKIWAQGALQSGRVIGVIPNLLSFDYAENTGAAFSILSDKTWLLGLISVVFCIAVIIYWIIKKPSDKLFCTSLMLLFSGAFGNAIDRVWLGYVIDFIRTDFIEFPIFNVADIAVTFGAILIVIYVLFFDKETK